MPSSFAALITLLALVPSRDTPHNTLNSSSGIHLP